jgi:crotonobetainyl-CoA:carnitine CoA-transferase CaiB-like acyl-CoA transferase
MTSSSHNLPVGCLDGIKVVDFSTLLPGPMASLILAEAGAEILKIERPFVGDDMRHFPPAYVKNSGGNFALLNRGKRSISLDLKDQSARDQLRSHLQTADIIIEQFRPGVMDRLGLGYAEIKAINPAIVYCSITGYGQDGPDAQKAGHDLNYIAETGLLALSADKDGAPIIPPLLGADIAGGTYPAVMSILMALRMAEKTGEGSHLDIAMCDNLFALQFWAMAQQNITNSAPKPGGELLSGGSPRYAIYPTLDGRYLAVGALEEKFWQKLCDLLHLTEELRDDRLDPQKTRQGLSNLIAAKTSDDLDSLFKGHDVCCSVIKDIAEAKLNPHFKARDLFSRLVSGGAKDGSIPLTALPAPLAPSLRCSPQHSSFPQLGEANDDYKIK